jgi:hypothetical protein
MPDPIKPEDVPAGLVRLALDSYTGKDGEPSYDHRRMLAAVLTEARSQIADFACGERTLTNAEMTEVAAELDRGPDGDPGAVYLRYARRMIGAWPGGYRG